MGNDNVLETRILLRYGTYSQWSSKNTLLKKGEAAVVIFPYTNTINNTDDAPRNTPPAIGIKIGDGESTFNELPWIQAIAADVYSWAKAAQPPAADTIPGLAEFVAAHSSGGGSGGGSGVLNSSYRIIYNSNTQKYILQYYDEQTEEWTNTSSEINLSELYNRISTIERWANGARTNLGNIEVPIVEYIYEEVINYLNTLDYPDMEVEHQFVTQVTQVDGKISVKRSSLSAADITTGILSTEHGGTGFNYIDEDEVLVGSLDGTISKKKFVTSLDNSRDAFATVGAIKDYVIQQTAGLTGAMHFIGETSVPITINPPSKVNPQIGQGTYIAQPGDVILANGAQEFVWTGEYWRLLGDEGSYAIKGSIVNSDISDNAAISQDKIDGLSDALNQKVDKEEGKTLLSATDKQKLDSIEENAQVNIIEHITINNETELSPNEYKTVNINIPTFTEQQMETINTAQANVIEHIFINGIEERPTIIENLPKSVGINFIPFTQEEKDKLLNIQPNAEVNKVETISFNGGTPIEPVNKNIDIQLDVSTLNLAQIAITGDISNLLQTSDTYVLLDCGSSTEVI